MSSPDYKFHTKPLVISEEAKNIATMLSINRYSLGERGPEEVIQSGLDNWTEKKNAEILKLQREINGLREQMAKDNKHYRELRSKYNVPDMEPWS